jgi:ubiquinone/menaquinone biosynthesis C-methylase UbiE
MLITLMKHGAKVVSIDLSDAIDVASERLGENENWIGIQGDITKLPFNDETFDLVYCEGVLQHTRNTKTSLKELVRVLKKGGNIAAWHYGLPEIMPWYMKLFHDIRIKRRERFRKWDRHVFIAYTAFLTSLGYLPLLGPLLAYMKLISRKKYNRSFQANWAMTMDALGWHKYQRFITKRKFVKMVKELGNFEVVYEDPVNPIINYKKVGS